MIATLTVEVDVQDESPIESEQWREMLQPIVSQMRSRGYSSLHITREKADGYSVFFELDEKLNKPRRKSRGTLKEKYRDF